MNGRMNDGKEVIRSLYEIDQNLGREAQELEDAGRVDGDLRLAYTEGLREAYRRFRPTDTKANLLLLGGGGKMYQVNPLLDALGFPDQDHLVLASEQSYGPDFFHLVEEKYGFKSAEPVTGQVLQRGEGWDADNRPVTPLTSDQVFLVAVNLIMKPYVEVALDPRSPYHYFERFGLSAY